MLRQNSAYVPSLFMTSMPPRPDAAADLATSPSTSWKISTSSLANPERRLTPTVYMMDGYLLLRLFNEFGVFLNASGTLMDPFCVHLG